MTTTLNKWLVIAITQLLGAIESLFISKVKSQVVQEGLRLTLNPVRATVNALADGEPRNAEQVEAIWKEFTNVQVTQFADQKIHDALLKIEDEHVRGGLSTISMPIVNMLRIVTDANPKDGQQIKEMWLQFIQDPNTHEVVAEHLVIPMIEAKINNAELAQLLKTLLKGAFDGE